MKTPDEPPHRPRGRARNTDPDTAHMAAANVPVTLLEYLFIKALRLHYALTTTEIANYWGMDRDSFSPRPPRLIERGIIEQCGKRLCENSSGKMRMMIAFRLRRTLGGLLVADQLPPTPGADDVQPRKWYNQ